MLPITTRGLFFGDSFFKNTWQDFHEAVRDVVSKWGNFSADEDLSRYMTLRAADVKNENQAVRSTEDEANYKVRKTLEASDGGVTLFMLFIFMHIHSSSSVDHTTNSLTLKITDEDTSEQERLSKRTLQTICGVTYLFRIGVTCFLATIVFDNELLHLSRSLLTCKASRRAETSQ